MIPPFGLFPLHRKNRIQLEGWSAGMVGTGPGDVNYRTWVPLNRLRSPNAVYGILWTSLMEVSHGSMLNLVVGQI
jgi:hypothetical protein